MLEWVGCSSRLSITKFLIKDNSANRRDILDPFSLKSLIMVSFRTRHRCYDYHRLQSRWQKNKTYYSQIMKKRKYLQIQGTKPKEVVMTMIWMTMMMKMISTLWKNYLTRVVPKTLFIKIHKICQLFNNNTTNQLLALNCTPVNTSTRLTRLGSLQVCHKDLEEVREVKVVRIKLV